MPISGIFQCPIAEATGLALAELAFDALVRLPDCLFVDAKMFGGCLFCLFPRRRNRKDADLAPVLWYLLPKVTVDGISDEGVTVEINHTVAIPFGLCLAPHLDQCPYGRFLDPRLDRLAIMMRQGDRF